MASKVPAPIFNCKPMLYHFALDAIAAAHLRNPDECFTDTIKEWLYSDKPQPTWEALADALQSPVVGHADLANNLPK